MWLDDVLRPQLGALARTEGTTWFVTLLSALQVLLWRYSQQEDIVVATPVANRELRAVEPLVGLFVNTIAIRGSLAGAPPFRDLLRRARARCLEALQHQSLPFDRIVESAVGTDQVEQLIGRRAHTPQ